MASTTNRIKQLFLLTLLPMSLLLTSHRRDEVDPIAGIDLHGNSVTVWEDDNPDIHIIYSATKTLSGAWTPEVQLSVTGIHSYSPHFFMNENGDCTAVWFADDPTLGITTLYGAIMPSGGSWGNIAQLSTANELVNNTFTNASINNSGNICICWSSYLLDSGTYACYSCFGNTVSGWGTPQQLD
jgi:hypothetical protein